MAISYNPRIVIDGLVSCLDAANSKSYPGSGTTLFDLVGNNDSTLTNGPTFDSGTGSIVFDGVNDFLLAPAALSMSGATINFWLYLDATIDWNTRFDVFSTDIVVGVNGRFLFYRFDATTLSFYQLFPAAVPYSVNVSNSNTLFTGQWKYVSVVSSTSGADTTMSVYVDAVLNNSLLVNEAATATSSSVYFMRNNLGAGPTKGKLALAQIYSRALTGPEIQQNFNATRGRFGI